MSRESRDTVLWGLKEEACQVLFQDQIRIKYMSSDTILHRSPVTTSVE